jgi:hypothetical protein
MSAAPPVGCGDAAIERLVGDYNGFVAAVLEELAEAGLEDLSERVRDALGGSSEPDARPGGRGMQVFRGSPLTLRLYSE